MDDPGSIALALAIIALWGGDLWLNRRKPKSTNERLGELIHSHMVEVHDKARWLQPGSGFACEIKTSVPMNEGRKIEIVVREVAE